MTTLQNLQMSMINIGDWTIEQQNWLDDHFAAYTHVRQKGDLPTFWICLSKSFLILWPVRKTLWPTMLASRCLTTTDLCLVFEAEKKCKKCIEEYFNNKFKNVTTHVAHIGDWTLEQWDWLVDYSDSYATYLQENQLETFFELLFDDFFDVWPIRQFLWPFMPKDQVLTNAERLTAIGAEEECKLYLMAFFEDSKLF
ncbi:hypothetical protein CY34DRAFT_16299 [Suillus luteus UH-Slu-Lm8-n1]|uniref:Uncharacterized protein n=1 Tax=Suillus luteus UH-Slu-Lm8-n1 TaxID=930992 RepID=A0A0D0AEN9_9AGAM|nr:hypothetical protein CY34DRAFT_16299 [Suillus luteus UH-Slu-Lm8-n1]